MIKFLANIIDQLDFALDHIILEDINYKRLSLVLIDNAVELTLHNYAEQIQGENKYRQDNPKHDPKIVGPALGRNFDAKVKLARVSGLIDDEMAASITMLHGFRNQLYHRGIMHEEILPALALFYFRLTCDVLASLKSSGYSWSNRTVIPHRAIKYIGNLPIIDAGKTFAAAFKTIERSLGKRSS